MLNIGFFGPLCLENKGRSCHHALPQAHTTPASTWILPQSDTPFLLMISMLACKNTHSIILFSAHFQTELEACPAALRNWVKACYEYEQNGALQMKRSSLGAGALKNYAWCPCSCCWNTSLIAPYSLFLLELQQERGDSSQCWDL